MTTFEIPTRLPILSAGKQDPGTGKVCAEQAIFWLVSGRLDLGDESDHPECVQPVLNALAIMVNDSLPDSRRGEMWPIILRQPGTARPEMEPVLSVRLAAWCAEQVLDLVRPGDWQVCRDAITAAQVWADNPSEESSSAASAASASASAASASACAASAASADAAASAASASASAASADAASADAAAYAASAASADAAYAPDRLLALLRGAQDEHERLAGTVALNDFTDRLIRLGEIVGVV